MEKLKKYQKQIFTFITIFLLLEFGVFPCLTMANTFANIIGAIALIVLSIWVGIELFEYAKSDGNIVDKNELVEAEQKWKEKIESMDQTSTNKTKPTRKTKTTKVK